jgi:CspA family cold shock protein
LPPLKTSREMTDEGTIKWFDPRRGFGFIAREAGSDVFLHRSIVDKYGLSDRQLEPGVPVRFLAKDQPGRRPEADAICIA